MFLNYGSTCKRLLLLKTPFSKQNTKFQAARSPISLYYYIVRYEFVFVDRILVRDCDAHFCLRAGWRTPKLMHIYYFFHRFINEIRIVALPCFQIPKNTENKMFFPLQARFNLVNLHLLHWLSLNPKNGVYVCVDVFVNTLTLYALRFYEKPLFCFRLTGKWEDFVYLTRLWGVFQFRLGFGLKFICLESMKNRDESPSSFTTTKFIDWSSNSLINHAAGEERWIGEEKKNVEQRK